MTLIDERAAAAHPIRPATGPDAARIAAALAAAFTDDPVFRFFSPHDARRRAMLPAFFGVYADAFLRHGEVDVDEPGAGAALWSALGVEPLEADPSYAERLDDIVGPDGDRLARVIESFEEHAPREPHAHLQFLGVRPERQGAGLGGALMAPGLNRLDRAGVPVYFEATSDRNRVFYERHGFRAHGAIRVPGGPHCWRMWRDPVD